MVASGLSRGHGMKDMAEEGVMVCAHHVHNTNGSKRLHKDNISNHS